MRLISSRLSGRPRSRRRWNVLSILSIAKALRAAPPARAICSSFGNPLETSRRLSANGALPVLKTRHLNKGEYERQAGPGGSAQALDADHPRLKNTQRSTQKSSMTHGL
eukprot:5009344-Pyramimonas_sp.AAC.1